MGFVKASGKKRDRMGNKRGRLEWSKEQTRMEQMAARDSRVFLLPANRTFIQVVYWYNCTALDAGARQRKRLEFERGPTDSPVYWPVHAPGPQFHGKRSGRLTQCFEGSKRHIEGQVRGCSLNGNWTQSGVWSAICCCVRFVVSPHFC